MTAVFHIAPRADWEAGVRAGSYRAASLAREGFIHCSTAAQVIETANRFFAGAHDLVLLRIDPDRLTTPLRWESAAGDPAGQRRDGLFPHLYGALDLAAVTSVHPLAPGPDGRFVLPAPPTGDRC